MTFIVSEYIEQNKSYSCSVGSRHYRAPELLLNYEYYNSKIDIWSVGCIFAELIFGDEPFFCGSKDSEELSSIAAVLGSEDILTLIKSKKLELSEQLKYKLSKKCKTPLAEFITRKYAEYATVPYSIDLLSKMLVADFENRANASECLSHPYFHDIIQMKIDSW